MLHTPGGGTWKVGNPEIVTFWISTFPPTFQTFSPLKGWERVTCKVTNPETWGRGITQAGGGGNPEIWKNESF